MKFLENQIKNGIEVKDLLADTSCKLADANQTISQLCDTNQKLADAKQTIGQLRQAKIITTEEYLETKNVKKEQSVLRKLRFTDNVSSLYLSTFCFQHKNKWKN